jgi:hypothetical protein
MSDTRTELIDEVSKWSVGLGILTMALAPLSLPLLILTAVAVIPFVVPLLVVAVAVALIALPVRLIRALGRRAFGGVSSPKTGSPERGRRAESRPTEVLR